MVVLFTGLTIFNLLCLCFAAVLGYAANSVGRDWHRLSGILAAMGCCAVHCIVFTYFIATAKWIQHAVTVKKLPQELVAPTRSFKRQAFPAALIAMASVIAAAFTGAAFDSYGTPSLRNVHQAFALAAIAINLLAALFEFRAIQRNARGIDHILESING